jgi:hypothetical protein
MPFTTWTVKNVWCWKIVKNAQHIFIDNKLAFQGKLKFFHLIIYTVKLGDKERFDKEQIGVKESFPMTKCQFTS